MAYGGDADWEMFCRGRPDGDSAGGAAGEAVELEPVGESNPSPVGGTLRHFFAPVVGLPYPNSDGTSRREAVRGLRRWERVRLAHRPDNPVDCNAVAVLRQGDDRQLGYLPAVLAAAVVSAARSGTRYLAVVREVRGVGEDLLGIASVRVSLLVLVLEAGASKTGARGYLLRLMNGPTTDRRRPLNHSKL